MEQDQIISSLFNMLQKSNNEKINMQLTIDKLTMELEALKKDLLNIRFKRINNQVENPAQYNEIKKSIARLYTTIGRSK